MMRKIPLERSSGSLWPGSQAPLASMPSPRGPLTLETSAIAGTHSLRYDKVVCDCQWACHEKVVQCPEGPVFTADRSGTKISSGRPSGLTVQRGICNVSQNDSSKRFFLVLRTMILRDDSCFAAFFLVLIFFGSANHDSAKRFLFCSF